MGKLNTTNKSCGHLINMLQHVDWIATKMKIKKRRKEKGKEENLEQDLCLINKGI